jgi:hypothetical protein
MSQIQIAKPGNDAAKNDEVATQSTSYVHDTGDVTSSSSMVSNNIVEGSAYFQNVPKNDLGDFLERLVDLGTFSIDSTDSGLSLITGIDPWALFLANASVADKTSNYAMVRGTLEILIVSAMSGGCYGSYVWSALCNGGGLDANDVAYNQLVANCMQVDHFTRIDCADSENVIMQLPWVYPYDFAALPAGPAGMWKLNLWCLSQIRSGIDGGNASGSFHVFARLLPGYVLCVPHFQGGQRHGHVVPNKTTAAHTPALHKKLQVGAVADKVGAVADKLSGVPIIGPYAATAARVAHGVGKIAHMFGFTRESDPRNPMPVSQRSVTNVAVCDGADSSDSASLMTTNEISIDAQKADGSAEDVCSYASLFNRWTLLSKHTWTSSQASGYDIALEYVSPFNCYRPAATQCCFTPAGYVGLPFSYWRGDMEYLLVVPASKFHRGTLQVYWIPFGSNPPSTVTNTTLNAVFDLGSGEEHTFTIGYARPQPYLPCAVINQDLTIVPQGYCNGQLAIRIVNPLTSQNETASVDILVFHRAGSNMDFAVPRNTVQYPVGEEGYLPTEISRGIWTLQGGALGDDDNHEFKNHVLVASSGTYPADELLFGEKISSVRALMQKPSRVFWKEPVTLESVIIPFMGTTPSGDDNRTGALTNHFTFDGYYRVLFVGVAASERWKFIPKNDCYIGACGISVFVVGDDDTPQNATVTSNMAPMTFCGANRGTEITIPYYYYKKFFPGPRSSPVAETLVDRNNQFSFAPVAGGAVDEIAIYHSFGPDLRVTNFRQVPKVQFTQTGLGPEVFWQF